MMMGIYCCKNTLGEIIYIGSSAKEIDRLEWNHRNYFKFKDGYESDFRKSLRESGQDWTFEWLMHPVYMPRELGEVMEQKYIQYHYPIFNKDLRPYETSTRRGRNNGELRSLLR